MTRTKALAAAFAGFGLWWGAWASSLPAVRSSTGATSAQLGLALFAVSLASLPAMIFARRVADRRRVVSASLALFGLAGMLPALARSPGGLFALLLALGVATGLVDVVINARASRFETARGLRVMDGMHAMFSIGVVIGGIGAGIARGLGARPEWILVVAGLVELTIAASNLGGPVPPPAEASRAGLGRGLLVIGIVLAVAFVVENGLETWSALFLERGLGTSPAVSGLGPGLFAASMATGRLLAQRVARSSVVGRMTFAGSAAAVGLVIAATAPVAVVALLGFVVAGAGLALSAPTLFGVAGRLGGGSAISTVAVLGYLGFLGGPPLFGAVAGATSLRGGFVFLGLLAALLAAASPILRRDSRS